MKSESLPTDSILTSAGDIRKIADTYHNWRNPDGIYEDVAGFCASIAIERVKELDYVLTPGRYVGLPDFVIDFDLVNFQLF